MATTALFTAALTLSHSLSPESFAAHVGRSFGRTLTVESVALSLRPTPRLRVEHVTIEGLGTARAAEVDVRLRPLLRGRVIARDVFFEDLRVVLRRRPDGSFEPLLLAPAGSDAPDLRAFPRMEAERGEIRIVQGEKISAVIGLQTLSLGRFDREDSSALVLSGRIGGGDHGWSLHPLRLRARLVHQPDRIALLDGRLRAEHAHVRWWSGRDLRGRFRFEDGRAHLDALDVAAFGGGWHAEGPIHLRGTPRLELDVTLQGVDLAALMAAARPGEAFPDLGRLRTRWQLRLPWKDGPRFDRGEGEGQLEVRGGTVSTRSLLSAALGSLGMEQRPASTPVESLIARASLRGGRLHSRSARLVTGDYVLEAAGSVGLDRSLDLTGRVHVSNLPAIPVTIRGALPEPTVETHVSRLPKDGLDAMAAALKKTGSAIARSSSSAGRRLRGAILGDEEPPLAD